MNDESPFEFPCDFPVKVFGHDAGHFLDHVVDLVQRHAPEVTRDAAHTRESRGGRYLAVTVTVRATSREQLDRIYRELSADDGVLFAL
ncbi:MAG: DUF493 domain-containing protein [Halofilum sp. (in: g-proteobacteria)]